MSNIVVDLKFGTPKVELRWPKGATIKPEVSKNAEGRFVAIVRINDFAQQLPGTHPTEDDAKATLEAYIKENRND